MHKKIEIYDPAMCCSTGVCGPSVDPKLIQIAADLENLKKQGVVVSRYNLSQEIDAFAANNTVKELLASHGTNVLPITIMNGEVLKLGEYPTKEELDSWTSADKLPASIQRTKIKSIEVTPRSGGCCGNDSSCC
ncbi:MAG: arsenic resistance operon repressor [Paenibacillaceae bacterium]|jgi:hypothetical protein|nr:arsenic resistance operon repressor [Paenibacillaceae bacterium]